jgi:hypothetical protein
MDNLVCRFNSTHTLGRTSMKKYQLKEIIREVLREEVTLESKASEDAKRQGLEYFGFGRYGTDMKVTHISQNGKLVPKKDFSSTGPSRMQMGLDAVKAAQGSRSFAKRSTQGGAAVSYDPKTNRLSSRTAGANRDAQRTQSQMRAATGTTNFDDPLVRGKGFTQDGDFGSVDVLSTRSAPFVRSAQRAFGKIQDKSKAAFPKGTPWGTRIPLDTFKEKTGND